VSRNRVCAGVPPQTHDSQKMLVRRCPTVTIFLYDDLKVDFGPTPRQVLLAKGVGGAGAVQSAGTPHKRSPPDCKLVFPKVFFTREMLCSKTSVFYAGRSGSKGEHKEAEKAGPEQRRLGERRPSGASGAL